MDFSEREPMCEPNNAKRTLPLGSSFHVLLFSIFVLTLILSVTYTAHGDQPETLGIDTAIHAEFESSQPNDAQSQPPQSTASPLDDGENLLRHLNNLGLPVGIPSSKFGAEQLRGLCLAREFVGLKSHRGKPQPSEMSTLFQLNLPIAAPKAAVEGLNVSITCQAAWYVQDGIVLRVMRATTGARPGWTPTGTFKVTWRAKGWTYSTIYKDARLYKIHHFKGAVGFHGVASPSWIKTKPASHGCVRLPNKDIDWLETRMPPGSLVRVYGTW